MAAFRILEYQTDRLRKPYAAWLRGLRDRIGVSIIKSHVTRMELGHFGDHRHIDDEIWELKIKYGPGYRVYYLLDERSIILLCGGDKSSQDRDVERARAYAADYWRRQ